MTQVVWMKLEVTMRALELGRTRWVQMGFSGSSRERCYSCTRPVLRFLRPADSSGIDGRECVGSAAYVASIR